MSRRLAGRLAGLALAALCAALGACSAETAGSSETGSSEPAVSPWTGERLPSVAFVVTCALSHRAPDDPLVHPGKPGASHEHAFFGNSSTDAAATLASLQDPSSSTTCNDPADRAAYWTPVPTTNHLRAYYDAGDADPLAVVAFPPGASGIAGSPQEPEPGVDTVAFRCGSPADGPEATGWMSRPPARCGAGTSVRYTFGQCGADRLTECTQGQTAKYVRLRLVMEWAGGMSGMGPHADFINAWDQRGLEELVAVCVRGERANNLQIKRCRLPGSG